MPATTPLSPTAPRARHKPAPRGDSCESRHRPRPMPPVQREVGAHPHIAQNRPAARPVDVRDQPLENDQMKRQPREKNRANVARGGVVMCIGSRNQGDPGEGKEAPCGKTLRQHHAREDPPSVPFEEGRHHGRIMRKDACEINPAARWSDCGAPPTCSRRLGETYSPSRV